MSHRLWDINQYEVEGAYKNRYDVTVLVNSLPMVPIELKRRGVDLREAFNQINRYHRDSFWAGSGLFDYVQLFVISSGRLTKYYSNTTRRQHIDEAGPVRARRSRKVSSNTFDFTSWWADASNKPIQDLAGFAKTFSPSTRCSTSSPAIACSPPTGWCSSCGPTRSRRLS